MGKSNRTARALVEATPSLDIRQLTRTGVLTPGSVSIMFLPNAELRVAGADDAIFVKYRYRVHPATGWQTVERRVPVCWTSCKLGGRRCWVICNVCGRKAVKLYLVGHEIGCRRCCGLVYAAQRKGRVDRVLHCADKIRERLGAQLGLFRPLPKPKWMRLATYERLRGEVMVREIRADQMIEQRLTNWAVAHAGR
jgi:hypothetical protein